MAKISKKWEPNDQFSAPKGQRTLLYYWESKAGLEASPWLSPAHGEWLGRPGQSA